MTAIIIATHMIRLLAWSPMATTLDGFANSIEWSGGTMIVAHSSESGDLFYDAHNVTVIYADGSTRPFHVTQRGEYIALDPFTVGTLLFDKQWTTFDDMVIKYSSPDSITLITCSPRGAQSTGRFFMELSPVMEVCDEIC